MTKTSFQMNRHFIATMLTAVLILGACSKTDDRSANHASGYSSDVMDKWMTVQIRLMKNATGIPNQAFSRHFSYAGIAALESIRPGLTGQTKWAGNWNGLTGLPSYHPSTKYFYPANANAALAAINRSMFPNANAADKAVIDSLETALNNEFLASSSQEIVNKSNEFGKAVAAAVYNWSESDGYKNASNPYTAPTGDGLWEPTPPANAAPASPYWGNNRTVVTGSILNTQPAAPISYSTDPQSEFFQMAKRVHDVSLALTDDQKASAVFWRDVPGITSPGHWLSITQQIMRKAGARLDKAALAYALTGAAINDAVISCWKSKYSFNLLRPVTYIRKVMGYGTWNSFIGTPAHPEYASGHAVLSGAAAAMLRELFGNAGPFTDHTYDYMGLAPRTFSSIWGIAEDAGMSRLYGGIHYLPTIQSGLQQGLLVTNNILNKHGNQ
jgi:hypothetical protein